MYSDKVTQSIAEAAKKVMDEELKGNQHKIDKNKNNKIDAQDFKLLRKEEQDLLEYDSKEGVYRHKGTYGYAGKGAEYGETDYKKANDDEKAAVKPAKRKYGARQNRRTDTKMYKEDFSDMLNTYEEKGIKGLFESWAEKKSIKEEVEQVEERSLSEPEMNKREEVVKSMKKGMQGFKDRYGDKAKSVMYATATKIAKKD
jgi:hypothetical protein